MLFRQLFAVVGPTGAEPMIVSPDVDAERVVESLIVSPAVAEPTVAEQVVGPAVAAERVVGPAVAAERVVGPAVEYFQFVVFVAPQRIDGFASLLVLVVFALHVFAP